MTTPKTTYVVHCFACGVSEKDATVIRFGLRMNWTPGGKAVHRQVGGIYLCERCWRQAQALRPRRGPSPGYYARRAAAKKSA